MATKYKMTWKDEQGGRWRKRYKGRFFSFKRDPGESKDASYYRCLKLWEKKKAEIDLGLIETEKPYITALRKLIKKAEAEKHRLSQEDTPGNRYWWLIWDTQIDNYKYGIENGMNLFADNQDLNDPDLFISNYLPDDRVGDEMSSAPPWANVVSTLPPEKTVEGNVKRFLKRKESQAVRGERSVGRYDAIRWALEAFVEFCGKHLEITSINSQLLSRYLDELEKLVDEKKLNSISARDRLQAAKQFISWAWEEELCELPRNLRSKELNITVVPEQVETLSDKDVKRLIDGRSETNQTPSRLTRLYIYLALNCACTQIDISELKKTELDWSKRTVTRKRSKTSKIKNSENVPVVTYKLWPETFELLEEFRSNHPTLVFMNENGAPLKVEVIKNGKATKNDNIASAYNRLIKQLKITKPFKYLRKTAASKLEEHPQFGRYAQYFLGQAPSSVAERHYVKPSDKEFEKALEWLRAQFLSKM